MCGIAGWIEASMPPEGRRIVGEMVRRMKHRGPDADGIAGEPIEGAVLGHARLSILDLSPTGAQPMSDASGRFVLTFNGEIFNYRELSADLVSRGIRLRGTSDTEVLLNLVALDGYRALSRLNGQWAFALWDREKRELLMARDRFGVRPLYYTRVGQGFLFASEVKALFCHTAVPRVFDGLSLENFLLTGQDESLPGRSFYDGIRSLPPGCWARLTEKGLEVSKYFVLEPGRVRLPVEAGEIAACLRELIDDAVRLRLRADVPVGVSLSGGIDSSTVAGIAGKVVGEHPGRLRVFLVHAEQAEVDERPFQNAVLRTLPAAKAIWVSPKVDDLLPEAERYFFHQEQPYGDASSMAHYKLVESARREGVTVLLSGMGGDEVFCGYPGYLPAHLATLLKMSRLREAWRTWRGGGSLASLPRVMTELGRAGMYLRSAVERRRRSPFPRLLPNSRAAIPRAVIGSEEGGADSPLDRVMVSAIARRILPRLLLHDDRNGAAWGVESRFPFLDHRVVEAGLSLPPSSRIRGNLTKASLRDAAADVLPDAVAKRTDKQGFHAPLGPWVRGNRRAMLDLVSSELGGFWDPVAFRLELLRLEAAGTEQLLWRLFGVACVKRALGVSGRTEVSPEAMS